jgi:hypothetical protein
MWLNVVRIRNLWPTRALSYPTKIKYCMWYWWCSSSLQRLAVIRTVRRCYDGCVLWHKSEATQYGMSQFLRWNVLTELVACRNNEDNKLTFHAASACEGSVWRAELIECSRRLELSHVICTRQELMTIIHPHPHSVNCVWLWALTYYFLSSQPIQSTGFFCNDY